MKLTYFEGTPPNFGDELNTSLWQHFLPPDFFDQDAATLFVGVGSVILHNYPKAARKVVMGSGYGGYTVMPDVHDGSWDIRFVRGPQTAEMLGLDPKLVIADAAILLRETPLPAPAKGIRTAFMPHYESVERGNWQAACDLADVHFLDPTKPTEVLISEILGADLVIAEAMHGAIVSDALRTPWIGVKPMHHVHRFKWADWARALDIELRPQFLFPSNCREGWAAATGRSGSGARARAVCGSALARPFNATCTLLAARSLRRLAKGAPQLSPDRAIANATERALAEVDRLMEDYARAVVFA